MEDRSFHVIFHFRSDGVIDEDELPDVHWVYASFFARIISEELEKRQLILSGRKFAGKGDIRSNAGTSLLLSSALTAVRLLFFSFLMT